MKLLTLTDIIYWLDASSTQTQGRQSPKVQARDSLQTTYALTLIGLDTTPGDRLGIGARISIGF